MKLPTSSDRTLSFIALLVLAVASVSPNTRAFAADDNPVRKIAEVTHPGLGEISGMARAAMPGVYWVHNDSGDSARLFAIRADGSVVMPDYVRIVNPEATEADWPGLTIHGASNIDWEDIAVADGIIYIGDVGNNVNARRDLGVYVVNEPTIRATFSARALRHQFIKYPDQGAYPGKDWHFDCEAIFWDQGHLYFLTKHRQSGEPMEFETGVKLYRLDGSSIGEEAELTLVDSRNDVRLATGADLSPNGRYLAVATYQALWVFERPRRGDQWLNKGTAFTLTLDREQVKQLEAVVWQDDDTILMANEQREIFQVDRGALSPSP